MLKNQTKKLPNGNVALYYQRKRPMEKPWIIICIALSLSGCFLFEYLFASTTYSLTPLFFIFFLAFIYWALYPCKNNEEIQETWLNKNVDLRIHNVLRNYKNNIHEVKRKYYQVTVGSYGRIIETYMLILLSNGTVLEYELKYHPATETEDEYHELLRYPYACKNKARIKAIKKQLFAEWWKENVNTSKNKLILCISLFFSVSIGLAALGMWLWLTFQEKIVFAFLGYVGLYFVFQHYIGKTENRILKYIDIIVNIPFKILYICGSLTHPIMTIFSSFLFTTLFAFGIPVIVITGLEIIFGWEFTSSTLLFVSLSIGSITCVFFSHVVLWIIKASPLRNEGNHKYEAVREDLSLYILDSSNINFIIYFAYLLFLTMSGYMHFQHDASLIHPELDEAILKAFLVFIAYSNVVKHFKNIKFDTKTFIEKVFKLLITHCE